jgi:hypothetical protein
VKKLIDQKFCKKHDIEFFGFVKNVPKFYVTLTKRGIDRVLEKNDDEFYFQRSFYKFLRKEINKKNMMHDLFAQRETAKRLHESKFVDFFTEIEMRRYAQSTKIFDALWIYHENVDIGGGCFGTVEKNVGCEIELSEKNNSKRGKHKICELDHFVERIVTSLENDNDLKIRIFFNNLSIQKRYEKLFRAGSIVKRHKLNYDEIYEVVEENIINQNVSSRIKFVQLK